MLPVIIYVLWCFLPVDAQEINSEEDQFLIEEVDTAVTVDPTPQERTPMHISIGVHGGVLYAPMLWIKESYFDYYAVPLDLFDDFSPWGMTVLADMFTGRKGNKIRFFLPVGLSIMQCSRGGTIALRSDGIQVQDTIPKTSVPVNRLLRISRYSLGAGLSFALLHTRRLTLSIDPVASFIVGISRFETSSELRFDYHEGLWNLRINDRRKFVINHYAFGAEAGCMLRLSIHLNKWIATDYSFVFSRTWSSVMQNPYEEWIVDGMDGNRREVRLNSLGCALYAGLSFAFGR